MRTQGFGASKFVKGIYRILLCLVVVGVTVLAIGPADTVFAAGGLPDISEFKAEPMTLPDGGSALYSFAVQGATNIQLVEAGEVIKEINGPAANRCKGTVRGRTTYQIRTGAGDTFVAMLVANNRNGPTRATLTLSFATKIPPKASALIPAASEERQREKTRSPEWKEQTSPFVPPLLRYRPPITPYPPPFAECPKGCDYCLRQDEAAARGLTQKCLEQPCYYSPDNQQTWYCYGKPGTIWCCKDGKVGETTKERCDEIGGSGYATQEEAMKACQLPRVWCCANGKVAEMTREQCAQVKGSAHATEAEAMRYCQRPMVWCCKDGKVGQITKEQCAQMGGSGYATEAEALRYCQQEGVGWCCANGKVGQTTRTQCAQVGGYWTDSQAEALRYCQQEAACWCCAGGKVFQTTKSQCAQYGGNCYATQAEALRYCQQASMCWCCSRGQVYQTTQSQCAGTCYSTQAEALRYCQQEAACWCCAGGKVFQSTKSQCAQMGGGCYSTQSQASAACQPVTRPPITQPPTLK
jgi:cytochrome b involved in lipid metabolism